LVASKIAKMNQKDFLVNSEDTGRFIVTSLKTGKKYFVEPIDNGERVEWGDLNPATKKLEGNYGSKHKGAIKESESLITGENGFTNIVTLPPGFSPLEYIENMEKQNKLI
jgi:hypothetical protein